MTDKFRMFLNDPEHCLVSISLIKDVDDLNVLLSRRLVELFRSRFGMSEIERKKERKKLPLIEGAGKA